MSKKNITRATIVILVLPIVAFSVYCCVKHIYFFDRDFWLAYMGLFGTVAVSWTALWQSINSEEKNQLALEEQNKQALVQENMTIEHPLLKIESVQLFGAFGRELTETYSPSDHKENHFIGGQLQGKLLIKVGNIGNGLLLNMTHVGIEGMHAELNSKSIIAGKSGDIFLFYHDQLDHDQNITIQYTNVRNFQYEQNLKIIVDEEEKYDYQCDENGMIIHDTIEVLGIDRHIHIILGPQKPIGFSGLEEDEYGPHEI